MSSQCPEFANLSNMIFDAKAKLTDEEYMEMYRLLSEIKTFKCPEVPEVTPDHDHIFEGETTITLQVSMYNRDLGEAKDKVTRWRSYAIDLEIILLCVLCFTTLFYVDCARFKAT